MLIKLKFKNKIFQKGIIQELLYDSFVTYGKTRTSFLINSLKDLGFFYATKSGLSIGVEDLKVPVRKKEYIQKSFALVQKINSAYKGGSLDVIEKSNSILYTWAQATNCLTQTLISFLKNFDPFNSLHLMVFSGARGNMSQVIQLMGMRGLMSDPTGQLMDIPILTNFRDGLTLLDYLRSTYGARKGLVDTALKTADAGYLTRRLVNSVNDIVIRDFECFTKNYLKFYKLKSKTQFIQQLLGRTCVDTLYDFSHHQFICYKDTCITEKIATNIYFSSLIYIRVYSVLNCELSNSICKKCYGWDISLHKLVHLGSPVGIIAAHSIGEPGTQLTMRTFHTGGSFTISTSRKIFSKVNGCIFYLDNLRFEQFRTKYGNYAKWVLSSCNFKLITYRNCVITFLLQFGDIIHVFNNQFITTTTLLAEISVMKNFNSISSLKTLIAPHSGNLQLFPRLNLISLLSGTVYDLPKHSFLNSFLNLKFSDKPQLLFYFKVYALISGFINYSINSNQLTNLQLIKILQIFLFPLFWDKFLAKIIFLSWYKKYFILEQLPIFVKTNLFVFAKQQTRLYDTLLPGFLRISNCRYKSFSAFNQTNLGSQNILLYLPLNFLIGSVPTIDFYKFFLNQFQTTYELLNFFKHCPISSLFNLSALNSFRTVSTQIFNFYARRGFKKTQLYFKGEILFNTIEIPFLTKVECLNMESMTYCYFRPITPISVSKNKSINKFGATNFKLICNTLFIPSLNNFKSFVYLGQSFLLLNIVIWLKVSFSGYCFPTLYTFERKNYLFLKCGRTNSLALQLFFPNQRVNAQKYQLKIFNSEYVLKRSILSFLFFNFTTFSRYKNFKLNLNLNPRLLILKTSNFLTCFFDSIKYLKKSSGYLSYNSYISPFVKLAMSGKICSYDPFLLSIHLGTPFFLSETTTIFHSFKNFVKQGEIFGVISFTQILTGDIVQGLPKLEELLEIKGSSTSPFFSYTTGLISFNNYTSNKVLFVNIYGTTQSKLLSNFFYRQYYISKGVSKNFCVNSYSFVAFGSTLLEGSINFKQLLKCLFVASLRRQTLYNAVFSSIKQIQILLIKKIYLLYAKQQIKVCLKHLEVLIRQLTSFIRILFDDSFSFLVDELIPFTALNKIIKTFRLASTFRIYYEPLIMGITTVSLNVSSFLSSASFSQTTKLLAIAAIEGKMDWLSGVKENLMLGQKINIT